MHHWQLKGSAVLTKTNLCWHISHVRVTNMIYGWHIVPCQGDKFIFVQLPDGCPPAHYAVLVYLGKWLLINLVLALFCSNCNCSTLIKSWELHDQGCLNWSPLGFYRFGFTWMWKKQDLNIYIYVIQTILWHTISCWWVCQHFDLKSGIWIPTGAMSSLACHSSVTRQGIINGTDWYQNPRNAKRCCSSKHSQTQSA